VIAGGQEVAAEKIVLLPPPSRLNAVCRKGTKFKNNKKENYGHKNGLFANMFKRGTGVQYHA